MSPRRSSPPDGKLLLLDSASLYFRSFHGVKGDIRSPDGQRVNAVRGFLDTIAYLVTERRPTRLVACWDEDWRPAFRVRAIPSYKSHRVADPTLNTEGVPDELSPQVPVIVEALSLLGLCRTGAAGYEADDVIGTLVAQEVMAGRGPVEVVSGDRDLFQVVDDDAEVSVLYVGRGVRKAEVVDARWLRDRYGIPGGPGYADMAVLRGDPSDGLPGVAGLGEKTAAGLIHRFGSLAALRRAVADPSSDLSAAQRRKLQEASDYLDVAPEVVRVAPDADLSASLPSDRLPDTPPDHQALVAFAERWGLSSSVTRVVRALGR